MLKCGACQEPYVPTAHGTIDVPCPKCGSHYVLAEWSASTSNITWPTAASQKPKRTLPTIGVVEAFDLERWFEL